MQNFMTSNPELRYLNNPCVKFGSVDDFCHVHPLGSEKTVEVSDRKGSGKRLSKRGVVG